MKRELGRYERLCQVEFVGSQPMDSTTTQRQLVCLDKVTGKGFTCRPGETIAAALQRHIDQTGQGKKVE